MTPYERVSILFLTVFCAAPIAALLIISAYDHVVWVIRGKPERKVKGDYLTDGEYD